MVLKGLDEDRGVIKSEECEEEVENVTAESRSGAGNNAEIQEVPGEEEQPARSPVNGANRLFVSEENAEDDQGNRCVKRFVTLVPLTGLFSDSKRTFLWLSVFNHMFQTRVLNLAVP